MKPPIVCDTGPLIALSLLAGENLLEELFHPVIPLAVFQEWKAGTAKRVGRLPAGGEIVPSIEPDQELSLLLDPGEATVIETALRLGTGKVLMDEKRGRKAARGRGLETLGTAGLPVMARRRGLVGPLTPLFEKLREESYWIAFPIVDWALQAAGETE